MKIAIGMGILAVCFGPSFFIVGHMIVWSMKESRREKKMYRETVIPDTFPVEWVVGEEVQ